MGGFFKSRRRGASVRGVALIGAVLAVAAAFEIFAPRLLALQLSRALERSMGPDSRVAVRVSSFPAAKMFAGRFDRVDVKAENVDAGGLRLRSVDVFASGVRVPLRDLWSGGKAAIKDVQSAEVAVIADEESVTSYFASRDDLLKHFRVELDDNRVYIFGRFELVGFTLDLDLQGRFLPVGPSTIRYELESIVVQNTELPRLVTERIVSAIDLSIDLTDLPVPVNIVGITTDDGLIHIRGES